MAQTDQGLSATISKIIKSDVPSAADRAFLTQIQHDTFHYFLTHTHPKTGLALDSSLAGAPASIAATGFALASFAIGSKNGWISYGDAYRRVEKIIDALDRKVEGKNGFYYHFVDPETGKRVWRSEVSSIDTALLMAGALFASTHFQGTKLPAKIEKLYDRVDWNWMRNGSDLFNHGWKPEHGFLPYYWDTYSEHLILQALALGSETHPVPRVMWHKWDRETDLYAGREIIHSYTGSLFTYQLAHAFIDFRSLNDADINYFDNSVNASFANREFCREHEQDFATYNNGLWGLSASLGPDGYRAYGAEPGIAFHDGTLALYGAIGSIVFTPEESIKSIRSIFDEYGEKLYGPYGFYDAFNLDRNWWAQTYIGIDQGIVILMLENFLNDGAVWKNFMTLDVIERWIERAELA